MALVSLSLMFAPEYALLWFPRKSDGQHCFCCEWMPIKWFMKSIGSAIAKGVVAMAGRKSPWGGGD
ncbi:MAG: hypothetical protein AB7F98_19070, partial [Novosphingobium sp.]